MSLQSVQITYGTSYESQFPSVPSTLPPAYSVPSTLPPAYIEQADEVNYSDVNHTNNQNINHINQTSDAVEYVTLSENSENIVERTENVASHTLNNPNFFCSPSQNTLSQIPLTQNTLPQNTLPQTLLAQNALPQTSLPQNIKTTTTLSTSNAVDRNNQKISRADVQELFPLIETGNIERVRAMASLIQSQKLHLEFVNEEGMTPLHVAVKQGNIELVEILIEAGADEDAVCCGKTVLHFAALSGKIEVVEYFFLRKKDVNATCSLGTTPMYCAVERGLADIVKYLFIKGAKINTSPQDRKHPLCVAIKNNHWEIAGWLLENNANVNIVDEVGNTPYSLAYERENDTCCLMLIDKGVDINQKIKRIPIVLKAANDGRVKIVEKLLKNFPEIKGIEPLLINECAKRGYLSCIKLIIRDLKADISHINYEFKENPIVHAFENGHYETGVYLANHLPGAKSCTNNLKDLVRFYENFGILGKRCVLDSAKTNYWLASEFLFGHVDGFGNMPLTESNLLEIIGSGLDLKKIHGSYELLGLASYWLKQFYIVNIVSEQAYQMSRQSCANIIKSLVLNGADFSLGKFNSHIYSSRVSCYISLIEFIDEKLTNDSHKLICRDLIIFLLNHGVKSKDKLPSWVEENPDGTFSMKIEYKPEIRVETKVENTDKKKKEESCNIS